MDGYSKYLLMVGIFVTLFTIGLFFVMYNTAKPNAKWPPEEQNCPDYWTEMYDATTNDIICYDTLRMSPDDDDGPLFNPVDITTNDGTTYSAWGGIPSNGGSITGETLAEGDQSYTRDSETTGFGKTGAWRTHCGRKKWALDNGIAWDGVSNSNVDCSNYMGASNPDNVYSSIRPPPATP